MNKKILIPIVLVLVAAIAVKMLFFQSPFLYVGTVEATEVNLSSRVSSVVSNIQVIEGQHVIEGQPLLSLACEDYKIADEIANENYDRTAKLFHTGSMPKETLDQMKNRKDDADLRIQWCAVKSPLTGTVLNKYPEVGEWVNVGTKLFTLANIKDVWAYVYVPGTLIAKLPLNSKVTGYLPELAMRPFEGTITKINDQAEFTPKNVQTREERTRLVFGVKITFNNPDEVLKPGMSIEVKLPE